MMRPDDKHLGDEIQLLLDQRLDEPARTRAVAHLELCQECRIVLESLRTVKRATNALAEPVSAPPSLEVNIRKALEKEGSVQRHPVRRWAPAAIAAALAVAAFLAIYFSDPVDIPQEVRRDFEAYQSGDLQLELETSDTTRMEQFFDSQGLGFEARVFDLAMMDYALAGGRLHTLGGQNSAFYVYRRRDGSLLLCQMYLGRASDLPNQSQTSIRENNGVEFRVHREGPLTMVFWQERDVTCVLASNVDTEDVVQLAFAKAQYN